MSRPEGHERWIAEEGTLTAAARRVFARSARRPRWVLGLALLAAAGLTLSRALKAPRHEATAYFLVSEGALAGRENAPPAPRDIRRYIASVALTRSQLERIMRAHGVARAWLARDRVAAVDDFRDGISVEVSANYFLWEREAGAPPRSARVELTVGGGDPDVTRAVLRDLADLVLRTQADERAEHLAATRRLLGERLGEARERTSLLLRQLEGLWRESERRRGRPGAAVLAQIALLEVDAGVAVEQQAALERRVEGIAFAGAMEDDQLGLRVELIDEHLASFALPLPPAWLAAHFLLSFALALLVAAAVVGAFDQRVYAPADLLALGLASFGVFPRFPGDDAGALRARASSGT